MMREHWPIAYFVYGICLLIMGVLKTPYYVGLIFHTKGVMPFLVIMIGAMCAIYMLSEANRTSLTHMSVTVIGLMFLFLPTMVFISPNAFDLLPEDFHFGDAIALTLGGILLSIAALEQPFKKTVLSYTISDILPTQRSLNLTRQNLNKLIHSKVIQHRSIFDLFDFNIKNTSFKFHKES